MGGDCKDSWELRDAMNPTERFECERQHAKLTRGECAKSYAKSNGTQRPGRAGLQAIVMYMEGRPCCTNCIVGAEHARGEAIEPAVEIVRVHAKAKPYVRQDIHTTRISMPKDSRSRVRFWGER